MSNDTLQTLTSINFSTMKPFENVDDMTNAAIMLGNSSIAALDKPGSSNFGNSNKKRQNEAAIARSPAKKLNQGASTSSGGNHMGAKTDKRSEYEKAYLLKHGLCFHCAGKVDLKGNAFVHRGPECPFKKNGIPSARMPTDFNPKDFQ